jgi:biotin-(acetyl-CoA carboxylase) ligase
VLLTTAAAVAGAGAIEEVCGCPIQIKWVNDLYLEGKKIAGIPVEAAADGPPGAPGNYAVVGIGVNVKKSVAGFPAEIADKAGVLCGDGESVSRDRLAAALIDRIWRTAKALEEEERMAEENRKGEDFGGGRPDDERLEEKGREGAAGSFTQALIAEARRRSCVLGREILVEGRPQLTMATAVGLDPHGFLIVEDGAGRRHVLSSGEISIRYAHGYNVDTRKI